LAGPRQRWNLTDTSSRAASTGRGTVEANVAAVAVDRPRINRSHTRLLLTLPLAIAAIQVVQGGADLVLATALERVEVGSEVTTYGWIVAAASLAALLVYPVAGDASDRVRGRFGRRAPIAMAGAVAVALALLGLGAARSVGAIGAAYVAAIALLPLVLVPAYAAIPDRVAIGRRGSAGATVGAATMVGGIAGNILAARFADDIELGLTVFGAILVGGVAVFVAFGKSDEAPEPSDHPAAPSPSEPAIPVARHGPDFAWVTIGRFALFFAYLAIVSLVFYVLRDYVGQTEPAAGVATFALVSGVATIVAALVAGPWSDRAGRRLPFVVGASVLVGAGALVPIVLPTFGGVLVSGAVIGLGFGTYFAVGTALATLVLPSPERSGRDIGVVGLSSAAALAVAPVAGSAVAAAFGYPALFGLAALACLVSAGATLPIRSVR
jgi:MFS family permease